MLRHLTLATLLVVAVSSAASAADDFISLFNGKDLTGWQGDSELWSVEDGCITGKTRGKDHLPYNKFLIADGEYADFEFHCEFRLEGNNNSGVQYRSKHDRERGEWVVAGYQADIHPKAEYTGMLYDEKGRGILAQRGQKVVVSPDGKKEASPLGGEVAALDLTKWHTLSIVAIGNRAVHLVDGEVAVDITDNQESERELAGVVALQVHRGDAMRAQFRKLKIRRISDPGTTIESVIASSAAKKTASNSKATGNEPVPNWIWLNEGNEPAPKVFFRKEVSSAGVGAARLYAAADDSMKIFIDGQFVVESSSWEKPVFVDISKYLDLDAAQKDHVLSVEAENGKGSAGLLVKIDFESGWRDAWSQVSDDSWLVSTKPQQGWKEIGFKSNANWRTASVIAAVGAGPWAAKITAATLADAAPLKMPTATPIDAMKIARGFNVELLYSVPKDLQGSWVNMCHDPKGRLIVSDQYGSLYRVTPPGIQGAEQLRVERINVDIGEAQGLLWAFDSLYVSVNRGQKYDGGLYRVRDTDGDDQLDSVETLRALDGSGEHGPHAVLPHPDGKSLVIICGNRTALTEIETSRVPRGWDEDILMPRVKGRFMLGTRAPGGYISRIDPDGKHWELIASGFRNEFDGAFNADGELFTYDADMEWDFNLPWYRPTRICHVVSGAEFGWRSTGGKWPVYYQDSLPPVVNVGPGSPTGVVFGYGSKFPAKYQKALFACDWSYGKLYAVHLDPSGSTYQGTLEEFVTGTPLPLTDVIVNPSDGAMYFLIGGRKVQSGLYRVTYSGEDSTAPATLHDNQNAELRATRRTLEDTHLFENPADRDDNVVVTGALAQLGSDDRFVRFAARVALENASHASWSINDLEGQNANGLLTGLLAYARRFERTEKGSEPDIDTPVPDWSANRGPESAERAQARTQILEKLGTLNWENLAHDQKLLVLRVLTLTFVRVGPPTVDERSYLVELCVEALPEKSHELNSELAQFLVYLQAPYAAGQVVKLLRDAPTQEEQIDLARTLRHLKTGWTPELQKAYFEWFVQSATYRGGASFATFIQRVREEAVEHLSDAEKRTLKPVLDAKPETDVPAFTPEKRAFVKEWAMDELVPLLQSGLKQRDFDNGRRLFGAAACFACHRFDNQGGAVGPDLTALSGRFSPRDILESVVDPSKQISDQYGSVEILMLDGRSVHGRIINLAGDSFRVQTNMLDPGALVGVDRKQIDEMVPSKISMMPKGLLNTLNEKEILDLMAYLLSRGDRNNPMFQSQ